MKHFAGSTSGWRRWAVLGWLALALPGLASAQAITPEQARLLEQLTPEQRAELLRQLGGGQGSVDQPLSQPALSAPKDAAPPAAATGEAVPPPAATTPPAVTPNGEAVKSPATASAEAEPEPAKTEPTALRPFGYDLFKDVPTTFAPASDIPVPAEYVIGPGDTVRVQLYGKENVEHNLVVSREGQLSFPGIGPIMVAGLSFQDMEQLLTKRVAEQMIGVRASITMGPLRSLQIFVLGEAVRPGAYTVSALATMTNALFASGGVKPIGSLRDIQLKRGGSVVRRLDLYDLLMRGDTAGDERLQPGDVIFVPPIGPTAGIAGEVRRPAIYELKGERTTADLVKMAGGFLPTAYPRASRIERIDASGARTIVDVDLSNLVRNNLPLRDGDVLQVYSVLERKEQIVVLSGHVNRPGGYQWREGMRLTDLIRGVDELQDKADLRYVVISSERQPLREVEVRSADLALALEQPASSANPVLRPRDQVMVFGIAQDRAATLEPLVQRLRDQATFETPERVVRVLGSVSFPGAYPFEAGMTVKGLLRAAYDLRPEADVGYALVRRELGDGRIRVLQIDLRDPGAVKLEPRDVLHVFPQYGDRRPLIEPLLADLRRQASATEPAQVVSSGGSLRHPGAYPLVEGMRVSDLLKAAGVFDQKAYLLDAEITRYEVLQGRVFESSHVVVKLASLLAGNPDDDLPLRPLDHLQIKQVADWREEQSITISGEVQFPGTYVFSKGETLRDVIERAGGLTERAYPFGAVFLREDLRKKEQEQINQLRERLRADLAATSLQALQAADDPKALASIADARALLAQLETSQAAGRLAINLPEILDGRIEDGIALRNGDRLIVPETPHEVTVIGEVNYPTSHLWERHYGRDSYIERSGGVTYKADRGRIYIVRANGEVVAGDSWFGGNTIRPGDTIVVPLDADRMKPLTLWSSIAQIVYQIGLSAAAFKAIGAF